MERKLQKQMVYANIVRMTQEQLLWKMRDQYLLNERMTIQEMERLNAIRIQQEQNLWKQRSSYLKSEVKRAE